MFKKNTKTKKNARQDGAKSKTITELSLPPLSTQPTRTTRTARATKNTKSQK